MRATCNATPQSEMWVDFGDFAFYRMEIAEPYYVGGFGVMGWVTADDYLAAKADPLADMAPSVIQHMNEHHADALVLMAQHFGNCAADSVRMTRVDRLGLRPAGRVAGGGAGLAGDVHPAGMQREGNPPGADGNDAAGAGRLDPIAFPGSGHLARRVSAPLTRGVGGLYRLTPTERAFTDRQR